jgi:hypothetical protein
MISLGGLVSVVVALLVLGLVVALLIWLVDYVSGQFPSAAPFAKVAKIIVVVVAVLLLIGIILNLSGMTSGPVFRP